MVELIDIGGLGFLRTHCLAATSGTAFLSESLPITRPTLGIEKGPIYECDLEYAQPSSPQAAVPQRAQGGLLVVEKQFFGCYG